MNKIDLKTIAAKVKDKPVRVKTSLYLDKEAYERFAEKCEKQGVSASKVLEEIIKEYIK